MSDYDDPFETGLEQVDSTGLIPVAPVGSPAFHEPLNADEARTLTDTIKSAAEVLWVLIARAHAGKAWTALGYSTWEDYVKAEFDISRSRSYQLLDQGRVIREIEAAVPEGTEVHLSEAAARDLKGVLEEVVPEIRDRTAGLAPDEASVVLDEIVEEQRERIREQRQAAAEDDFDDFDGGFDGPYTGDGSGRRNDGPTVDVPPVYDDADDIDVVAIRRSVNAAHDIYSALSALAGLPDALDDVVAIIPRERVGQVTSNLASAQVNLARFAALWNAREDVSPDDQDEEYSGL